MNKANAVSDTENIAESISLPKIVVGPSLTALETYQVISRNVAVAREDFTRNLTTLRRPLLIRRYIIVAANRRGKMNRREFREAPVGVSGNIVSAS